MPGFTASSCDNTARFTPRKPTQLLLSLLLIGVVALSVHVLLLAAGVPFPLPKPPLWARWLHLSLIAAGALAVLRLATASIAHLGVVKRTLILAALLAMIQETLRAAMPAIITGGWLHSAIQLTTPLIRVMIVAWLCVVAVRWVRGGASWAALALLVGAVGTLINVGIKSYLAPLMSYAEQFARPEIYHFPYPFHITVAAYITFVEAVAGATLVVILVWDHLPGSKFQRLLAAALLTATLKGVVGGFLVYSFFSGASPLMALFSWSQFLLEFLTLGFLTALAWDIFGRMPTAGRG